MWTSRFTITLHLVSKTADFTNYLSHNGWIDIELHQNWCFELQKLDSPWNFELLKTRSFRGSFLFWKRLARQFLPSLCIRELKVCWKWKWNYWFEKVFKMGQKIWLYEIYSQYVLWVINSDMGWHNFIERKRKSRM